MSSHENFNITINQVIAATSNCCTSSILCNKYNKGIYNLQPVLGMLGAHMLPVVEDEGGNESESIPANVKPMKKCVLPPKKKAK